MRYLSECGSFFRETRRHFRNTGALLPSSRFLARALVTELGKPRPPARILEVGPGTGSVTAEILRRMQPRDQLDAIEVNESFLNLLQHRLDHEWAFRHQPGRVNLIHAPVQQLEGEGCYDFIVSCLALNNFHVSQVRDIFRSFVRLLKPGGTLTYFEYVLIRQLTTPFVSRHERGRLARIGRVVDHYIRSYQIRSQRVLINVPPAIVRHLHLKPANGTDRRPVSAARNESSKIPSPISV